MLNTLLTNIYVLIKDSLKESGTESSFLHLEAMLTFANSTVLHNIFILPGHFIILKNDTGKNKSQQLMN